MATRTGRRRRRFPFGRIASWLIGVPLTLAVVAALGAAVLRGNPALFVAISERFMPRKPVVPIAHGPEGDAEFFKYGAIGNEGADGIPFKIWAVLPEICPSLLPDSQAGGYRAFGFTYEADASGAERETPIGLSRTRLGLPPFDVEVLAINCATCHVQTWRTASEPVTRIFVGGANNRLDAQAYTRFMGGCADSPGFDTKRVMEAIRSRFPDTTWPERLMFRYLLVPITQSLMRERLGARFHWTWSRPPWGPGRLSPFNPVKFDYLEQPVDTTIDHGDVMPAWNVVEKQALRQGPIPWHWDGLSWDLREVVLNSALGDGMTRFGYRDETINRLIRYLNGLKSPKAPLPLNPSLRDRGAALFGRECASCHAPSGARVMTIIPRAEIATDPHRIDMWTPESAAAYNNYDKGGKNPAFPWVFQQFQKHDGYVAQPLDGIWLTGPYLHNGSVPTLDDLLKPAGERPKAFIRGGEEIDLVRGGYVSPDCRPGYYDVPGMFCYDTKIPGNSNAGHEYGTGLTPEERAALVHYLLTL